MLSSLIWLLSHNLTMTCYLIFVNARVYTYTQAMSVYTYTTIQMISHIRKHT